MRKKIIFTFAFLFFIQKMGAHVFLVEGNIGAGKSTLLNYIEQLGIPVFPEPVKKWQHINGENLLDLFYKDPKRWSYSLLTYILVTRIEQQKEGEVPGKCSVLDRSYLTNRYCFGKHFLEHGNIAPLEWSVYLALEKIISSTVKHPQGIIYLRTSPEICYERMKKRNRSEEQWVTLDYLKEIHSLHEEWLIEKKNVESCLAKIPVLILDGNKDFEHDQEAREDFVVALRNFISDK